MAIDKDFDNPDYWHGRAEEARTAAEAMKDAEAREAMLRIVQNYEQLAARAERLKKFKKPMA
jgi:hypothetical protein